MSCSLYSEIKGVAAWYTSQRDGKIDRYQQRGKALEKIYSTLLSAQRRWINSLPAVCLGWKSGPQSRYFSLGQALSFHFSFNFFTTPPQLFHRDINYRAPSPAIWCSGLKPMELLSQLMLLLEMSWGEGRMNRGWWIKTGLVRWSSNHTN